MLAGVWTLAWAANVSAQTNVPPRIPAAAATNYLNQEVIVTDRVAQVTLRPTIVFLNLNQRYPDSPLTCVIKGSDTNNFSDLKNYQDKEVEVSGRIADFQGKPEMVLTNTNQIKILADTPVTQPVIQPATNEARPLPPAAAKPPANRGGRSNSGSNGVVDCRGACRHHRVIELYDVPVLAQRRGGLRCARGSLAVRVAGECGGGFIIG
jgi:hypothetical protein